jgi:DNA-binding transcriptional LysR family regulator
MLVREQFIVREPGSGTRDVSARALALHGARLTNTIRVGGTEAIKQAVAAGLGLAIVSRAAADDQLALGRIAVISVNGLTIRRTLAQIKLRGRVTTAAARELEFLLAEPPAVESVGDASGTPS